MKDNYIIRIDNCISLITNSSSELFVIKGDLQKEMVIEMMNVAFEAKGITYRVDSDSLINSNTYDDNHSYYDMEYEKDKLLEMFGEEKHHLIEELFHVDENKSNYYHFKFDRDLEYKLDYAVRDALIEIGFEYLGSDY